METKNWAKRHILLVDDEKYIRDELQEIVAEVGCKSLCATSSEEAMGIIQQQRPDVIITDVCMAGKDGFELTRAVHDIYPNLPVIIMTGVSSTEKAVLALRAGVYDYVEKPFHDEEMTNRIKNALHTIYLFEEVNFLRHRFNTTYSLDNIIGKSPEMQSVFEKVLKVAPVNCSILITGENGTGKDLIANAIHNYSKVCENRFLPINCSAIPAPLLESELFGHVKGAFTGAVSDKVGLAQVADGGSLFLDEIGDLPVELQPKILRLIETKEIQKVGSNKAEKVDIRIVSATNQDLKAKIQNGSFRKDLYYRIQTVEIPLPPLRERKSDIELLAVHFMRLCCKTFDKSINSMSSKVLEIFHDYNWPGNVRELKHAIEHACVFCDSEIIRPLDLPVSILPQKVEKFRSSRLAEMVDEFIKRQIELTLKQNNHDMPETSKQLGISQATIYRKLKKTPAKLRIVEIESEIKKNAKQPMPLFD